MNKLSVVISAYNEERNIEDCLKSVKGVADEIIVIDNSSTDKTNQIAKKYTTSVFTRENNLMLNVNKNFGISKASKDLVLVLDADERLTDELKNEITELLKTDISFSAYSIPRKNIIFGKWIKNTGWYPDRQIRLFKRGMARFAQKHVHEMIEVDGSLGELNKDLYHINYVNVSQFLDKMIRIYTISEAENLINSGYKIKISDAVKMPSKEFVKRFFAENGFKDGSHGLMLSLLMAFYHFVVFLRVWEVRGYPDSENVLKEFEQGNKEAGKEVKYWLYTKKNEAEKNPIKKVSLKILRRMK